MVSSFAGFPWNQSCFALIRTHSVRTQWFAPSAPWKRLVRTGSCRLKQSFGCGCRNSCSIYLITYSRHLIARFSFLSAIVCPWLDFGLPPRCTHRLCGDFEERLSHFCHAGSGRVGRVWSPRNKSLEILCRDWELNPGHREDRQWAIPLSCHDQSPIRSIMFSWSHDWLERLSTVKWLFLFHPILRFIRPAPDWYK